jgi:hypothetical protein
MGKRNQEQEQETDEEDQSTKVAQQKNKEAWNALRRFGQPLIVVTVIGTIVQTLHERCSDGQYNKLLEPAVSFPLAGLALAACVNFSNDNIDEILKNYAYFFAKGLFVSAAMALSNPSEIIYSKLNEGWLKNVFQGNMLNPEYGFGLRMMVLFHTINLFANSRLTKWIYG